MKRGKVQQRPSGLSDWDVVVMEDPTAVKIGALVHSDRATAEPAATNDCELGNPRDRRQAFHTELLP